MDRDHMNSGGASWGTGAGRAGARGAAGEGTGGGEGGRGEEGDGTGALAGEGEVGRARVCARRGGVLRRAVRRGAVRRGAVRGAASRVVGFRRERAPGVGAYLGFATSVRPWPRRTSRGSMTAGATVAGGATSRARGGFCFGWSRTNPSNAAVTAAMAIAAADRRTAAIDG